MAAWQRLCGEWRGSGGFGEALEMLWRGSGYNRNRELILPIQS
jgi:hypothetical protein